MSTSLRGIRSQLDYHDSVSNAQKEIKAVLEVHVNAEPQSTKILEGLKQNISVGFLYCN